MKYSKEKEREYYNEKLVKDEVTRQIKDRSFKINWLDVFFDAVGIFIGLQICDKFRSRLDSSLAGFWGEIVLITLVILIVRMICFYINKSATLYSFRKRFGKK